MSKLGKLRRKVGYDTNVPRCATCIHRRTYAHRLRDSLPMRTVHICKKHDFECASFAVCDHWQHKDGSTVEGAA
jgi:hypothetical protein